MKQITWAILATTLLVCGCNNELDKEDPFAGGKELVRVELTTKVLSINNYALSNVADEIKYITALFFDTVTGKFYRSTSFGVVSDTYTFNLPANNWTIVLLGTGDGLPPVFTTSPVVGQTSLSDVMVTLGKNTDGTYNTTREYFYAQQVYTVTASTTGIPLMTLQRMVSKFKLTTTTQLADSLARVKITLNNIIPAVYFNGLKNMTYTSQNINTLAAGKVNGVYDFTFYSFGSKNLGTTVSDFNILMEYVRISQPANTYNFPINNPADLKAGGMVINSKTTITMGL